MMIDAIFLSLPVLCLIVLRCLRRLFACVVRTKRRTCWLLFLFLTLRAASRYWKDVGHGRESL